MLPEQYVLFANQFSLESIIAAISRLTFDMFKNGSEIYDKIHINKNYIEYVNGIRKRYKIMIIQWKLVEMMYYVIANHNSSSDTAINDHEFLKLYMLFFSWNQKEEGKAVKRTKEDIFLRVYGLFGEQKRYQDYLEFKDNFSRECYILEDISKQKSDRYKGNFDIKAEIEGIFSMDINRLKIALYSLTMIFLSINYYVDKSFKMDDILPQIITDEEKEKLLKYYSVSIDEIKESQVKQQIFYSKPFIRFNDKYFSVSPFLAIFMFENFEYWAIRDKYKDSKDTRFVEDFGVYFENYIAEVFSNCLDISQYKRIEENANAKRADWMFTIGEYTFLVEQKSNMSSIKIKQQLTDLEELKKYMFRCWGKAVKQLNETEKALKLRDPIKIILVYDDYYKAECLDEFFRIAKDEENDGRYWLVNKTDFEILLYTYKNNPDNFFNIVKEKCRDELNGVRTSREFKHYFLEQGISINEYLTTFGIYNKYESITDFILKVGEQNA